VERLLDTIDALRRGQGAQLLGRWRARDALRDVEVELVSGEQRWHGLARSVDSTGQLVLQTDAGTQLIIAGEIERVLHATGCPA
jgi:BirA family biotin operon repressor/biotin-[acetyl-CoA-carboxylase] ligase